MHSTTQVKSLVEVIQTQGWDVPIVVDRHGVVIKGHGRRLAALSMGLKEVPVIVRRDLTDAQVKAARLSDNRVAMGDFDVDLIRDELASLQSDGFDLNVMGFGEKELEMMLGNLDQVDISAFDEAPDAPKASESLPDAHAAETTSEVAVKEKELLVSDLLGFKQVSAKYRNALVEFQYKAEETTGKVGAEAFGEYLMQLAGET
ncbi:ParB/Srx family N-terminal domain-containing protein [Xanthomonas phage JGB6]|nr:ParB/Srx family N-terminal domain-containing protein [Xanthomonas phage JGB6]